MPGPVNYNGEANRWLALLTATCCIGGCVAEKGVVVGYAQADSTVAAPLARPGPLARPTVRATADASATGDRIPGLPLLVAEPAHIKMPTATPGTLHATTLRLRNNGTGTLLIERLELSGDGAFAVRNAAGPSWQLTPAGPQLELAPPKALQPNEAWALIVDYRPQGSGPQTAVLTVRSNDPTREIALAVSLRGQVDAACLELAPAGQLDFAKVDIGTCRTRVVDARNCGDVAVIVSEVGFAGGQTDGPFSLSWGAGQAAPAWIDDQITGASGPTVVLQPGAKLPIAVTYCPASMPAGAAPHAADLVVQSSAPGDHQLSCRGEPVQPACPKAHASIEQGDVAHVGSSMQFSSSLSKALSGPIVKTNWTLAAPPLSSAALWPSASSTQPTVAFDVAGTYTACLHVWDVLGNMSCQPSCLTVHATDSPTYAATPIW